MISTTFRVGKRMVKMSLDEHLPRGVTALNTEWTPDFPKALSKAEWKDYRRGRNLFLAEVARAIGGKVLVAEI